tara:strand:- start:340 stop:543 length:204 start_codon:yes stop_codon:yes gene_type:complete
VNDIIEVINDLKEIRRAVKNNESVYISIDQKIEKYQKILDEFENANKDKIGDESPDLTWAGTSGYSV